MATKSVQALLDDIRMLSGSQYEMVSAVRKLVKQQFPSVAEEVKYGGILFSSEVMFCGVFAYSKHVSVEFSHGAGIRDELGHLEGSGKGRRHLKLYSTADIADKDLAHYLPLAHKSANTAPDAH